MAGYIDGFVLPVPKGKLGEYSKICGVMGKLMRKYGAIDYFECVGDDLKPKHGTIAFGKMAKAKKGETVIFFFHYLPQQGTAKCSHGQVHEGPANERGKVERHANAF